MAGIVVLRWIQFSENAAPPGSDGGQWLAFSHQMFLGEQIKAGFENYPPVVPFLLRLTSSIIPPLLALKFIGILASVAIAVPVYLLLRTAVKPRLSAVLAVATPIAPYHSEVLIFGGYPQLTGTVFLVLTAHLALKGLESGQRRWFVGAAGSTAATVGSNALTALEMLIVAGAVLLIWSLNSWRQGLPILIRELRAATVWWIAPAIAISLLFVPTYLGYFSWAGPTAANPLSLTFFQLFDWLESAWQWEFLLWVSVAALSMTAVIRAGVVRRLLVTNASLALAISGLVTFVALRELRSLHIIEISLVLSVGVLVSTPALIPWRRLSKPLWVAFGAVIALSVTFGVGAVGARRSTIAYDWYQVVNASVLSSLEWLRANRTSNAKVVATGAPHGQLYGWWIEGYAHLPTYVAGDPSLFFTAEERAQVALARRLLMPASSPLETRTLADSEGIRFLFLDKQVLERPVWDFVEAGFVSRFENDRIIIMERNTSGP